MTKQLSVSNYMKAIPYIGLEQIRKLIAESNSVHSAVKVSGVTVLFCNLRFLECGLLVSGQLDGSFVEVPEDYILCLFKDTWPQLKDLVA